MNVSLYTSRVTVAVTGFCHSVKDSEWSVFLISASVASKISFFFKKKSYPPLTKLFGSFLNCYLLLFGALVSNCEQMKTKVLYLFLNLCV